MKKILIVDDNADISELLAEILNAAGYAVLVSNLAIPLNELSAIKPDLILLDHFLSGEQGADYCSRIKDNSMTAHIPVIMISAGMNVDEIAKDAFADGYINKPFDIDELEEKIKVAVL